MALDPTVQQWRKAGRHLPPVMRDFHEAKAIFRTMHAMLGPQLPTDTIKRPTDVEGMVYVMDCFLWFMARHGYTLQRSRASLPFDSLDENVKAIEAQRNALLTQLLGRGTVKSPETGNENGSKT